ncbi:MAG: hypothetical protein ITG00_01435 [Flavobacterium sp.]|nr:hypothetical protein [Flavobacterium sp.]
MKIILMFFLLISCKYNSYVEKDVTIVNARLTDYGKLPENAEELSESTAIKAKYLTSALFVKIGDVDKIIPIDDSVFNHEFFADNHYINTMVRISIRSFQISGKEILIAEKISPIH